VLHQFIGLRAAEAQKFLSIAQEIAAIQTGVLADLRSGFTMRRKQLKTDLRTLESLLRPPLDALHSSISGYDRYFKQLQKELVNPQQARRAVEALDEKLGRVQNYYAEFHRTFVEYCTAREVTFAQIESAVKILNGALSDAIQKVGLIDGAVVAVTTEPIPIEEGPPPDLGDDGDEVEEPTGPFYVKLRNEVTADAGAVSLKRDDRCLVVEAIGNKWKVQDSTKRIWTIPQQYLVPDPAPAPK
jgi:hypothetical protein